MSKSLASQVFLPVVGTITAGVVADQAGQSGFALIAISAVGACIGAILNPFGKSEKSTTASTDEAEDNATLVDEPSPSATDALQHLPFGVLIISRDGTLVFVNHIASAMFSVQGGENQPVSTLRTRRLLDKIDEVFQLGKSDILTFTLSRMGDANLKAHLRLLDSDEVLVAIEDETQAQRAGAMHRDFVANASHELKTPLAAISGIIETLLGHARNDPDATERFLELLQAQANRMTRLVEDLLSLNRIELNARVQPDELNEVFALVSEAVDVLRPIAETEDIQIDLNLPETKVWVLSDRDELSQLFGNLIDNAIKYGGKGTKVTIRTRQASTDAAGMIGVEVVDQGPGIAREHLPRLTERFYRVNVGASRAKGGTGLGLAIVKHILSRHKGRVEIDSTVGHGSCFRVWLPIAQRLEASEGTSVESLGRQETVP